MKISFHNNFGQWGTYMQLRASALAVSPENPFEHDKLGRQSAVETVSNILKNSVDPVVMSVNAPWGHGKSTFLRMLTASLEQQEFRVISFNAWESDYIEDPFVALLGDTESQLKKIAGEASGPVRTKIEAFKNLGARIMRASIPVAVKIATAGLLSADELTELALAEAAESYAKERVKHYGEAKESIVAFRERLSEIASSVYGKDSTLPLVFIIDELDRCRPTHAVRLLEIVKHFFSIDRVAFVVAMDSEQLGHSVRTLYGQGMDVDGYLKRFFDLELNLPSGQADAFLEAQFARFGLDGFFADRQGRRENQNDKQTLVAAFKGLFGALDMSFRERERAFTLLSLAVRGTAKDQYLQPVILGCMIILKIKNSALYRKVSLGAAGAADVMAYFSTSKQGEDFVASHYGSVLEASLMLSQVSPHEQHDMIDALAKSEQDEQLSQEEKERARMVALVARENRLKGRYVRLGSVVSKIDLLADNR